MAIETEDKTCSGISSQVHPQCVVCGITNSKGLHLEFNVFEDGSVKADIECNRALQGYPGILHGGVISTILDGAMGHCMFARGQAAVTVEMTTRFRSPVLVDHNAIVMARITRKSHPLYLLQAEIIQNGQVKATAKSKFYDQPALLNKAD